MTRIKLFREEIRYNGIRAQTDIQVETETWNASDAIRVPMSHDRWGIALPVREGIKKALS